MLGLVLRVVHSSKNPPPMPVCTPPLIYTEAPSPPQDAMLCLLVSKCQECQVQGYREDKHWTTTASANERFFQP